MMTKGWVNPREVSTSVNCFKLTPYTNQHAQSQAATVGSVLTGTASYLYAAHDTMVSTGSRHLRMIE